MLSELIALAEQNIHWTIIILIFLFQFLAFVYSSLANKIADAKIKDKVAALQKEYAEKQRQLQTEYQQERDMLHNQIHQRIVEVDSYKRKSMQELAESCNKSLIIKQLHLLCMNNSFVFDKTAIDDTLINGKKYNRSISEEIKLVSPIQIAAKIRGQSGKMYYTTLRSCTCTDFQTRKEPCKHMYKLAEEAGFLTMPPQDPRALLLAAEKQLNRQYVQRYSDIYHKCQNKYRDLSKIRNSSSAQYPWLAKLYADYDAVNDEKREELLRTKRPPAPKAADEVKAIRQEKHQLQQKAKALEYQLSCYESLFPWLEDYKDVSPTEIADHLSEHIEPEDSEYNAVMRQWLSREEYDNLPNAKKYQMALDRYKKRKKSAWQIGIEYERYIGYLYECAGYTVRYQGALTGLEDMGRDLIADNGAERLIIQCKRWAKEKVIHEKHIFQLFGTMVLSTLQDPYLSVHGVFVTSTTLTDVAKQCAAHLGIQVIENKPLSEYPLIKCNISKDGEKIYHLPMDLQYDRVIITTSKGDCYASTVQEAEALGFRRAYRWSGSGTSKN